MLRYDDNGSETDAIFHSYSSQIIRSSGPLNVDPADLSKITRIRRLIADVENAVSEIDVIGFPADSTAWGVVFERVLSVLI